MLFRSEARRGALAREEREAEAAPATKTAVAPVRSRNPLSQLLRRHES